MLKPFHWILVTILLILVGCPTSDDALLLPDSGLMAMDTLIDVGSDTDKPQVDVPKPDDEGSVEEDTKKSCTDDSDCSNTGIELKPCETAICQVSTGECVPGGKPDGSPCDDNDACTITACKSGACVVDVKQKVECNDGNECTADSCKPESGCHFIQTTGTTCDDGDPCTADDKCKDGVCFPGDVICELGSVENPANNCKQIKDVVSNAESKVYYLKPAAGAGAIPAYCNMDDAGGGWARIAIIKGDIALCSYENGIGDDPKALLDDSPTTVALSSIEAMAIPTTSSEVLLVTDKGIYVFRSTNAEWNWANIASGTINAFNLDQYGVEGSVDGVTFTALAPAASEPQVQLLGGKVGSSSVYSPFIGVGKYFSNSFSQDDAACQSKSGSAKGLYYGSWGVKGAIYLK